MLALSLKLNTAPSARKRSYLLPGWLLTHLFLFFTYCIWQAIEEEGGNPDEIVITPELTSKKATPKRAAKGERSAREGRKNVQLFTVMLLKRQCAGLSQFVVVHYYTHANISSINFLIQHVAFTMKVLISEHQFVVVAQNTPLF